MNKRVKKKKLKQQEMKSVQSMELGNLFFGNSRGLYRVNRDWQDEFIGFLSDCKIDGYGYYEGAHKELRTERGGFENEIFKLNPYYWTIIEEDDYSEAMAKEPNFIYKPTNFQLKWYKYPLRDSFMNQDISLKQFLNILNKCKESLLGEKNIKQK